MSDAGIGAEGRRKSIGNSAGEIQLRKLARILLTYPAIPEVMMKKNTPLHRIVQTLLRRIEATPVSGSTAAALAAWLEQFDSSELSRLAEGLAGREEGNPSLLMLRGLAMRFNRFLDQAIDLLERSAAADAGSPRIHYELGLALLVAGRGQEAVGPLTVAVDLAADDTGWLFDAFDRLRAIHHRYGEWAVAAAVCRWALERLAQRWEFWYYRGIYLEKSGNLTMAATCFQNAIKQHSNPAADRRLRELVAVS